MTQTLTFDYMDYKIVLRKDYILQKKENQEKEPQKLIFYN